MRTSPAEKTGTLTGTEAAVLGMLARHGESSGYDLNRCAEHGVGYVWAPAKSRIYAVLPRLVAHGYATRRAVTQELRPDKQLYRITEAGERALRTWLETIDPGNNDLFLLRVFFGDLMPAEALVAHVEEQRHEQERLLEEYREIESRIAGSQADYHGYLTLRVGLARAEATLAWAGEVLTELKGGRQ